MMYRLVWLSLVLCLVEGRESPNAEKVREYFDKNGNKGYSSDVIEDALLDVPGLIAKYGYPIEVHNVRTDDGYILEMHRIPHGRDNNVDTGPNKPITFIQHGLMSSCAEFVTPGPGFALAYILAEEGYDVWLGNARGNYYSRRHIFMNPDARSQDFWKFSWDEIGFYDIAAMVDHILETTGQSRVHYIGHSQGGTTFLTLNSLIPEYNDKFISFQGLAPASFFDNNEHPVFQFLAPYERYIEGVMFTAGFGEVAWNSDLVTFFGVTFCHDQGPLGNLCAWTMSNGDDYLSINTTMLPKLLGHSPAGASIRQVAHYGQSIRKGTFGRFDHGTIGNLVTYGSFRPPAYDLSKITVPAYLHYGLADMEVNYRDIYLLAEALGNTKGTYQVERETFNHLDFAWGMDARDLVYPKMIELMREAENL